MVTIQNRKDTHHSKCFAIFSIFSYKANEAAIWKPGNNGDEHLNILHKMAAYGSILNH